MLFDLILKRPKTVVLVFTILTFFISLQALSLIITSDIEVYTPTEEPIVETLMEMRDEWPMDSIIIFVQSNNITKSSVLKEILAVEKAIISQNSEDTGIIYTISIASFITSLAENFPLFGADGLPEKQEHIDFIFQFIPDEIKYQFISRDYTSAAIIVAVSPTADADTLIEQIIKPLTQKTDETQMKTTGIVAMYKETVKWTMERIVNVVPLSLFLIALVIYVFHRSIKAVIISISTVFFSISLTFGTIGLLPVLFTPQVIAVIPLLASLGVAYSLHIISHYAEEITKRPPQAALKRIISTTGRAILISAVTTMVGFASLLTSSMPPVANIGLAFLIGMTYCFFSSMILAPALLIIFDYHPKKKEIKAWNVFSKITTYRKEIGIVLILVTFFSAFAVPFVSTESSIWDLMPEDMDSAQAMNAYSEKMESGQIGAFYVGVQAGDVLEPKVLEKIDSIEKIINYNIKNASAYSIVDVIKSLNFGKRGSIPSTREQVERIIDTWVGEELVNIMLNDDKSKAIVSVNIPPMSIDETKKPVDEINELLHQSRGTFAGTISLFTGTAPIFIVVNSLLMGEQLKFMMVSLVLVFLCLLIVFRSFRYALFTFIPLILILIWEPALLVLLNIPLDVATIMVSSVAIGAGIDFSVHITQRVRDELQEKSALEAIKIAVSKKSVPLIESTLALVVGCIPVLLMDYQLISQFILITLAMLAFSCIAALFGLSSLYSIKDGRWLEKWGK